MIYKPVPGTKYYEQVGDDSVVIGDQTIPIPSGFRFDGASIPWAFRPLIGSPYDPDYIDDARDHDYCFVTHCVPFNVANKHFADSMKRKKVVSRWRRFLMGQAVGSIFGLFAYRKVCEYSLRHLAKALQGRPDAGFYMMYIKIKGFPRDFV